MLKQPATAGLVWVDGAITPETEARVSVLDHGFLYGDSVYEAVRTFGGTPFLLEKHLERLRHSAAGLGIAMPSHLVDAIDSLMAATRRRRGRGASRSCERLLRIILTRGIGPLGYEIIPDQKPNLIILSRPVPQYPPTCYTRGISLAVVNVRRNSRQSLDPALKTSNLLNVRLAYMEARRRGVDDALMLNDRAEVAEASGSNIFIVVDKLLWTPPLDAGILQGITREFVLTELAPQVGLPTCQKPMPQDVLKLANEAFITSTTRSIMPVTCINDAAVGDGQPGPWTRSLMRQFEARVAAPVFPPT